MSSKVIKWFKRQASIRRHSDKPEEKSPSASNQEDKKRTSFPRISFRKRNKKKTSSEPELEGAIAKGLVGISKKFSLSVPKEMESNTRENTQEKLPNSCSVGFQNTSLPSSPSKTDDCRSASELSDRSSLDYSKETNESFNLGETETTAKTDSGDGDLNASSSPRSIDSSGTHDEGNSERKTDRPKENAPIVRMEEICDIIHDKEYPEEASSRELLEETRDSPQNDQNSSTVGIGTEGREITSNLSSGSGEENSEKSNDNLVEESDTDRPSATSDEKMDEPREPLSEKGEGVETNKDIFEEIDKLVEEATLTAKSNSSNSPVNTESEESKVSQVQIELNESINTTSNDKDDNAVDISDKRNENESINSVYDVVLRIDEDSVIPPPGEDENKAKDSNNKDQEVESEEAKNNNSNNNNKEESDTHYSSNNTENKSVIDSNETNKPRDEPLDEPKLSINDNLEYNESRKTDLSEINYEKCLDEPSNSITVSEETIDPLSENVEESNQGEESHSASLLSDLEEERSEKDSTSKERQKFNLTLNVEKTDNHYNPSVENTPRNETPENEPVKITLTQSSPVKTEKDVPSRKTSINYYPKELNPFGDDESEDNGVEQFVNDEINRNKITPHRTTKENGNLKENGVEIPNKADTKSHFVPSEHLNNSSAYPTQRTPLSKTPLRKGSASGSSSSYRKSLNPFGDTDSSSSETGVDEGSETRTKDVSSTNPFDDDDEVDEGSAKNAESPKRRHSEIVISRKINGFDGASPRRGEDAPRLPPKSGEILHRKAHKQGPVPLAAPVPRPRKSKQQQQQEQSHYGSFASLQGAPIPAPRSLLTPSSSTRTLNESLVPRGTSPNPFEDDYEDDDDRGAAPQFERRDLVRSSMHALPIRNPDGGGGGDSITRSGVRGSLPPTSRVRLGRKKRPAPLPPGFPPPGRNKEFLSTSHHYEFNSLPRKRSSTSPAIYLGGGFSYRTDPSRPHSKRSVSPHRLPPPPRPPPPKIK